MSGSASAERRSSAASISSIDDGEFVVFVGPSGCGKSTLLRMISGLEDITSGELRIGGRIVNEVPPARRGVAMVFQSYALYPHLTVRDNMGFGLKVRKVPADERARRVDEVARTLKLEALLDRFPRELSGGQRQRVAIGRAIVRPPGGLPVRRAAVEPRRGTARPHALRDRLAAQAPGQHHDLCHPRPDRGDDPGGQDRGPARRARRAGRHAARTLRAPRQPVRRGVHRQPEDEHPAGRRGEDAGNAARGRRRRRGSTGASAGRFPSRRDDARTGVDRRVHRRDLAPSRQPRERRACLVVRDAAVPVAEEVIGLSADPANLHYFGADGTAIIGR